MKARRVWDRKKEEREEGEGGRGECLLALSLPYKEGERIRRHNPCPFASLYIMGG